MGTDRRTNRHDEGSSPFRNFQNAPKTQKVNKCVLIDMVIPAERNVEQKGAEKS